MLIYLPQQTPLNLSLLRQPFSGTYICLRITALFTKLTKSNRKPPFCSISSTTLRSQSLEMKVKAIVAFKSKLFTPWRKVVLIFRFKLRKPVFIRSLQFRASRCKTRKALKKKRVRTALLSVLGFSKQSREMDRLEELKSASEAEHKRRLLSSPLTPAYITASRTAVRESFGNEDVEDACRSFENYLVEMIVEEGKVSDLMDVEELLYCWKNLKSPVFFDLVCRFYGELCKDLFSSGDDNAIDSGK